MGHAPVYGIISSHRTAGHLSLRLYRYLHLSVGPAALKASATVARPIVSYNAQDVLAGFAECRGRAGLAVERGRALCFFDEGLGIGERHRAGAAKFAPGYGYRRTLGKRL